MSQARFPPFLTTAGEALDRAVQRIHGKRLELVRRPQHRGLAVLTGEVQPAGGQDR